MRGMALRGSDLKHFGQVMGWDNKTLASHVSLSPSYVGQTIKKNKPVSDDYEIVLTALYLGLDPQPVPGLEDQDSFMLLYNAGLLAIHKGEAKPWSDLRREIPMGNERARRSQGALVFLPLAG